MFILSLYKILAHYIQENKAKNNSKNLIENVMETKNEPINLIEPTEITIPITVDFQELLSRNKDVIAWIYCPNSDINYPVVQSNDNDYYLHRLLDGSWNIAGTIFMDYRCDKKFTDLHTVIYGHNMKNGSMFTTITKYKDQEFYEEHPVWYLLTPNKNYKIEIFAGYVTPKDSKVYSFYISKAECDELILEARKNSKFMTDVNIQSGENIVTFSTYSYEYEDARFIVMGVMREIKNGVLQNSLD